MTPISSSGTLTDEQKIFLEWLEKSKRLGFAEGSWKIVAGKLSGGSIEEKMKV